MFFFYFCATGFATIFVANNKFYNMSFVTVYIFFSWWYTFCIWRTK